MNVLGEPSQPVSLVPVKSAPQLVPVSYLEMDRQRRRKLLWLAVVVLGACGITAWFYIRSSYPAQAREAYDAGIRLMRATRYQQAILNFSRAIDLQPQMADAYRMRAKAYLGLFESVNAVRDLTQVHELEPKDAMALIERGRAYLDLKDYPRAAADAENAVRLAPKLAAAYNLRGTALRNSGRLDDAVEDFSRALSLLPDMDNYFQRAATYQILGEHQQAIADFNAAIEISPEQPHPYYARAKSRAAVGDRTGAEADFAEGRRITGF